MYRKVLRERKRHTARRVASARYAALSPGGGWGGGGDGVPPTSVNRQTDKCENITFPHPSDTGGKN